ncbi:MAG: phage tail tape measure protein [Sodaliphilus pleomorphus]|uniref:phage tail tape measure protein n=1 Tax=Sodaliphilus pleomorphus TaxID=2606626 RepID=UPI002A757D3B|nr:phage tail tape measure protein [Sodaliphilus pleomorphus]MDY2833468.1 phage tail tape measure protein [Sodaliphilus pleomorphus]MDY5321879.1 phage tail tape measure protein [Prevotella sp.]
MSNTVEFHIKIKGEGSNVLHDLTVEATGLDDIIAQVGENASQTGERLKAMAAKSMVFDGIISSLTTLKGIVGDIVAPFDSFEKSMRAVNTMAGKGEADFEGLTDKVKELSANIPLAREELANGLYQTISNGVPEENWMSFLEQSSKSAVGGLADLGQTVTVTSTLIKNYGLSWDQAGAIQDKIQMTAKNGVTSFEQLGQALPMVSGSASQLGVSMDELMAVFATTTGVTGNTSEVATQLSAVLNSLIKPSSEATKAANEMGIGFNAASVQAAGGLQNFLLGLDKSITEYSAKTGQLKQTIYGQLFGSAEALRLLGSLTGEQKDKFAENIGAMADSAGTIDEAFNNMSSTGEAVGQMLKNQVQSILDWAGSMASTSAPYIELLANTGLAITSLTQLRTGLLTVVTGLKAVRIATLAQAAASKIVAIASKAWKIAQIALNFALSANPIGIVIMAIAGLVAILVEAYNNCETFRNICDKVWSVVKDVAGAVWDYLVKAFEKASEVIKKAWEWVKKLFGIKDDGTARQTADIERNTKATNANTKAKAKNAQVAPKKNQKQNAPDTGGSTGSGNKSSKSGKSGTTTTHTATDKYGGTKLIANASSYKELGNNIQYYQNKLETTKGTETATIRLYAEKIKQLQEQQDAITHLQDAVGNPKELNTLGDIDKAISYQQELRSRASATELAGIDREISRLNDLKTAFERNAHVDVGIDKITTYRQLESELQYYSDMLKTATASERTEIQKQINALNALRDKWDETLEELKKPDDISRLDTIDSLDKAISYYEGKQKKASAAEISDIARTIGALERKRDSLKQLARLPEMEQETDRLGGLGKAELKVELKAIGMDGLRKRIKELQNMLSDTKNPMSASQRKEMKKLVATYEDYEKILRKSDVTVEKSWSSMKGIGGGISSLTETLQENRGAWATITGVVDSAIQIYQGVRSVISIVEALTAVTTASNAATAASGVATTTAAAAKTASAPEEVAAATASTVAAKAEAMAYRELAASEFMAAHAYIPFAGAGIAAGFIGMMQGIVGSVAVTPFANGGLLYGPTLALMGEYAGAKSNPEVVAPLDKLKSLIGDSGSVAGMRMETRVRGRDLVMAIANETRINRKRTNIKL